MKKLLSLAMAFCLSLGCLTGCGETTNAGNNGGEATAATTATTTTTAATTTTTQAETTTTTTTTKATTTTTAQREVDLGQLFDLNLSNIIFIGHNSAGGLQYLLFMKYIGSKEIKYYTIDFDMYNSVMDPAYDDITRNNTFSVRTAGPAKCGDYLMLFEKDNPSEYCSTCYYLSVTKIELEYMDGTKDVSYIESKASNYMLENSISKCNDAWTNVFLILKEQYPDFVNS